MPQFSEKSDSTRDLPISLQGIEKILIYLDNCGKETSSIRSISEHTNLSMRVVKNVLLQLEKFNQVERVLERNNVLPKWRITKFGRRVLKEAKIVGKDLTIGNRMEDLLKNINIQPNINKLKAGIRNKQDMIVQELNSIQLDLSKALGTILSENDPYFEDLLSRLIRKIKTLKQRMANLPKDPSLKPKLKKIGEKAKKITKKEEKDLLMEVLFFNSLIYNQSKRISEYSLNLLHLLENQSISISFSIVKILREELRLLYNLVNKREKISTDSHLLSEEELKRISKNQIDQNMLDSILFPPISKEIKEKIIVDLILGLISKLESEQIKYGEYYLTKNIPLIALHQLLLSENPELHFTVEELENVINKLANKGYLPGIKVIKQEDLPPYKIVELISTTISEEEIRVIEHAIRLRKFSLADIIDYSGLSTDEVKKILRKLTKLGIIEYSNSNIHGERWYVITKELD